jgi:hypothetical protein
LKNLPCLAWLARSALQGYLFKDKFFAVKCSFLQYENCKKQFSCIRFCLKGHFWGEKAWGKERDAVAQREPP